jgi:hypothetical protein
MERCHKVDESWCARTSGPTRQEVPAWILQGIDVLGGSGMSGDGQYEVLGVIVGLIGIWLLQGAIRGRQTIEDPYSVRGATPDVARLSDPRSTVAFVRSKERPATPAGAHQSSPTCRTILPGTA